MSPDCLPASGIAVTPFDGRGRHLPEEPSFGGSYAGRWVSQLAVCLPILLVGQVFVPVFDWHVFVVLANFIALAAVRSRRQLVLTYPLIFVSGGALFGQFMQTGTGEAMVFWLASMVLAIITIVLSFTTYSRKNDTRKATEAWLEPGDGTQIPLDLMPYECAHGQEHTLAVARGGCVQLTGTYRLTHDGPASQVVLLCVRTSPGGASYVPDAQRMLEPS